MMKIDQSARPQVPHAKRIRLFPKSNRCDANLSGLHREFAGITFSPFFAASWDATADLKNARAASLIVASAMGADACACNGLARRVLAGGVTKHSASSSLDASLPLKYNSSSLSICWLSNSGVLQHWNGSDGTGNLLSGLIYKVK
jgi:hypothetical protein